MEQTIKKPVAYKFDPKLVERMQRFIKRQKWPPTQTAVVETALREYLDRAEQGTRSAAR